MIDVVFILRRLQEEYNVKGKGCGSIANLKKGLKRESRNTAVGDKKERYARSFCLISEESVSWSK